MRLDEAFRDQQVGPVDQVVQPEGAARRQGPLEDHVLLIPAVVNDKIFLTHQVRAELGLHLVRCRQAMEPGSYQDLNRRVRVVASDFRQQQRQRDRAGHRAGVVAGQDQDTACRAGQVAEQRRRDRMRQGVQDLFLLGFPCLCFNGRRFQDGPDPGRIQR